MESNGLEKCGPVLKRAEVMRGWNPRYLVSDPLGLCLKYYKECPSTAEQRPRGTLSLVDCTVSVDVNPAAAGAFRFLIVSADQRVTYHLQVSEESERSEWMRVVKLISQLATLKQRLVSKYKHKPDSFETFHKAASLLLESLKTDSAASRKALDGVAHMKWSSKERLIELQRELQVKMGNLKERVLELKTERRRTKEALNGANEALYVLAQMLRRSNALQNKVLEFMAATHIPFTKRCAKAVGYCQETARKIELSNELLKALDLKCEMEAEMIAIIEAHSSGGTQPSGWRLLRICQHYHCSVHLHMEVKLASVRTECERGFHSERFAAEKLELCQREQGEIEWVISEVKRGIDRLSREGLTLAADDFGAEDFSAAADQIVPVLAHRSTWAEASQTLFALSASRMQEHTARRGLDDSLKARELVGCWFHELTDAE